MSGRKDEWHPLIQSADDVDVFEDSESSGLRSNDEEEDEEEEIQLNTIAVFDPQKKPNGFQFPAESFYIICFLFWGILFSMSASVISFWIPALLIPETSLIGSIDISSAAKNIVGAFIFGIVRSLSNVKYQYIQTYMIYDAIMSCFCSAFTTFGNVVADTGWLLLSGRVLSAIGNVALNIIASIIFYEIGRRISRKFRKDVEYVDDTLKLENEDIRMKLELEKELSKSESIERGSSGSGSSVFLNRGIHSLDNIERRRAKLVKTKKKHITRALLWGHYVVAGVLIGIILINMVTLLIIGLTSPHKNLPSWFPSPYAEEIISDFLIFCAFTVSGALLGSYLSREKYNMALSLQWGTFRVNMISCILIGCANNLSLFGSMFTFSEYSSIILYRFIVGFCGSFSSFGGLIDNTVVLFHGKTTHRKWNSVKNLFYNFFVCLFVFIFLLLCVRIAILLRYWSPHNSEFLCGGTSVLDCF